MAAPPTASFKDDVRQLIPPEHQEFVDDILARYEVPDTPRDDDQPGRGLARGIDGAAPFSAAAAGPPVEPTAAIESPPAAKKSSSGPRSGRPSARRQISTTASVAIGSLADAVDRALTELPDGGAADAVRLGRSLVGHDDAVAGLRDGDVAPLRACGSPPPPAGSRRSRCRP